MIKNEKLNSYRKASQKISIIDGTVVSHSSLRAAIDGLHECIAWSEFNREPAGAILVGQGGTGKTTVCNAILKEYPTHTVEDSSAKVQITSAFYASVPSPSTIKTLAAELLRKLGDPRPRYGTADALTERLITLLQTSRTKIILLDEFQHLLADSKVGGARANKICDWIKTLVNETGVTICLVGTPDCEALVSSEPQLAGRFARRFRLYPLEVGTEDKRGDLVKFLLAMSKEFIEQLQFSSVLDFSDHANAVRVWAATGGNVRFVMRLLKEAGVITLSDGRTDLTMDDMAQAYAKGVTNSLTQFSGNPFAVSYDSLLAILGNTMRIRA